MSKYLVHLGTETIIGADDDIVLVVLPGEYDDPEEAILEAAVVSGVPLSLHGVGESLDEVGDGFRPQGTEAVDGEALEEDATKETTTPTARNSEHDGHDGHDLSVILPTTLEYHVDNGVVDFASASPLDDDEISLSLPKYGTVFCGTCGEYFPDAVVTRDFRVRLGVPIV